MARSLPIKFLAALALALLVGSMAPGAPGAQGLKNLKIGLVNLNKALNRSSAGERSKNILLASKSQKENELKAKELELKKKREALKNNIMLTDEARQRQERELKIEERSLGKEVRAAQRELQTKERKLTESIFIELKTVIAQIAKEEKFDLILEKNASQVILYSSAKFENITEKVIERYNKYQGTK